MTAHWRPAQGADVDAIVTLTQHHFEREADTIFQTDPLIYAHNVLRAIVDQFYAPLTSLIWIAQAQDGQLLGMVWAERGQRAVWSADEMAAVRIIHVDLRRSARERVVLCHEALTVVESWALQAGVPIICSTTMRSDQEGFLRLHERRGYERRGSICYKRLGPKPGGHGTDHGHEHSDGADLG